MEQVELLLRKGARCERERARLSSSRREREVRGDLISRINIALFNFKSEARFTSQTRDKLREKIRPFWIPLGNPFVRYELINYEILTLYLLNGLSESY